MVRYCSLHYIFIFGQFTWFWGGTRRIVKAENHAVTLCPRHGHRDGVDVAGYKYLAVLIWRALLGYLADLSPTLMLGRHKALRNKKWLGAGHALHRAALVYCRPLLAACSPIATADVRYSLLLPVCSYSAFSSPCFASEQCTQPVSKKEMLHMREAVTSLKNRNWYSACLVTTLIIQKMGSIAPF